MNYEDYHHLNHVKEQQTSKKTLWFTLMLTLFFTIVEIVGGLMSNSLALLSDSAHMISDVIALGLSMAAIYMAARKPNQKYTFGFLRFEIIASFLNGLALAVIAVGIIVESIKRMIHPQEVDLQLMLLIASIGLVVNLVLTVVLSRSTREEENLNVKSALWHFIGDLLSSVGVITSAVLIHVTGYSFFDPLISMIIGGIIFAGGAKIIRESHLILMESVPEKFDLDAIRRDINGVEGVEDVHELHLWSISTDHYSLTAHVFVREDIQPFCVILAINHILKTKYGIAHTTIQIEHPAMHDHGEYGKQFMLQRA
ncbi:cation diffusion facilitator family transporter [Brevibacillus thermoruber]|jgi:cobalt-zinc-cadmium efflux system protein|uniref:Cation diffusion facilitator family transporter n=1 Tax=Brevibacillus thermoruber TaxID=33942 RepID=A0A9X3Z5M2_9BACL|nr:MULTISPECIES: cation diffusion facilitator family transporter [Brevibacillus]MDA5110884.1 cation diffusion facilitator family transporter [Brevibacillus thermoruber]TRY23018.1 cation transporter [Brevibacillus sp. LEMMJ03]UYZ13389.1 cation diffusion facilitator family transporter [Brevibacillus sp. WF146]